MTATLLLAPLLALFSPSLPQEAAPGARPGKAASGERVIVEPEITLEGLLRLGEKTLGRVYQTRPEHAAILQNARPGLASRQEIPLAEFEPWLETILVANDFVTLFPPEGSPQIVRLAHLKGQDRGAIRSLARFVPAGEVARFRHPAAPIQTSVTLRYLDPVRAVTNLRPLLTDSNLEMVSVIGDTVVVAGLTGTVSAWLEILKAADVESAATVAPSPDRSGPGEASPGPGALAARKAPAGL
ncbi:MAG TPA: hypothetical protein VFI25_04935, partial [Planctomycetota bacterium]|nr:hypothetical protein [Planctomycetota bacterium]